MLHQESLKTKSTVDSRQSTVFGPSALALGLLLLAASSAFAGPPAPRTRATGRFAGDVDATGLTRLLARQTGKVVLVNFWATWCEPCRQEYPDLARLQKALSARGLQVVGISTDFASALPAAEKFLAEQKPTFPNYHKKSGGDDQDFINAVDKGWGGELPFSVLYDRNGKKSKTLSGKHSYADYEREVLALLQ
jgi:thiol-disulfide isomerase/thioredoxin